jgi:GT2 family glycosyltransferase
VLGAFSRTLVQRGPAGVLRLAASGQPFQSADPGPIRVKAGPAWPPTLDDDGAVPAAAWVRWRTARLASAPIPPGDGPPVVFAKAGQTPDTAPEHALVVFLGEGDAPDSSLAARLSALAADPVVEAVSFDLWRVAEGGVRPMPLPGANPVLLRAHDYLHGRLALRAKLARAPGTPRERLLAWLEGRSVQEVRAGWRRLGLPLVQVALDDALAGEALRAAPARLARPAEGPFGEPVSAVLCTRDKGRLTRQLVRQLLRLPKDALAEVVIVSNGTTNPYALQTLADLRRDPRVQVIDCNEPFNFSRLNNAAVAQTRGRGPLLFINNDIAPVSEDWLDALRGRLAEPGTGAVGPLLLYPREPVQHAGMYLRRLGGAGHSLRGAILPEGDPLGLAAAEREVSALTGAVLLVDRAAFLAAGGFDEDLAIALQDVDLCLKLNAQGLRNVFEPRAVLLHMESATVGGLIEARATAEQRWREWARFMDRWGDRVDADPFHPAGFDPEDEGLRRLARP